MIDCKKFIVLDVETTNDLTDPLVYDLGFVVCDRHGYVYEKFSFVIEEIFLNKELMKAAYYAEKIPQYWSEIWAGSRKVVTFHEARWALIEVARKYGVTEFYAYNALFDRRALNTTQRYLTKSKHRWFAPYGVQWFCIWNIASQAFFNENYVKRALENNWLSEKGRIKTSAEVVYKYLINNPNFVESHTGLEDVMIELEILVKAYSLHRQYNRKINRGCWRVAQKVKKEIESKEGVAA